MLRYLSHLLYFGELNFNFFYLLERIYEFLHFQNENDFFFLHISPLKKTFYPFTAEHT